MRLSNFMNRLDKLLIMGLVSVAGAFHIGETDLIEKLSDNSENAARRTRIERKIDENDKKPLYFIDRGEIGTLLSEGKGSNSGDLNRDGYPDFICVGNEKMKYFQNDKGRLFFEREFEILGRGRVLDYKIAYGSKVVIEDLNGDSREDICVIDSNKKIRYFERTR